MKTTLYQLPNDEAVGSHWLDDLHLEPGRSTPRKKKRNKAHQERGLKSSRCRTVIASEAESSDTVCVDITLPASPAAMQAPSSFCSLSEAICAELLKRYIPHFKLQQSVTYQVPIGRNHRGHTMTVDFLVDGVLFEYHPPRYRRDDRRTGDFAARRTHRVYTDMCGALKGEQRDLFQEAMRSHLASTYYVKRRCALDKHPLYRRLELVVATCPEDVYFLILRRFGRDIPPSVELFMRVFDEIRDALSPSW